MAEVHDSKGVQAGNNNVQVNLFPGEQPRGPVVAGKVPQEPPAFQPREDLMAQLRVAGPGASVVRAVTGMRGVGKTQLAAACARRCINEGWRLVAWINAENAASTLGGLEVVANRLGISTPGAALEAIGADVRNRVEADGERCLIVYDNVTDPSALRPYIPSAGKSLVLVTSTQASALALGWGTRVAVFTDQESRDFLIERSELADPAGSAVLARELGYLPLALAQAAAVIKARHLTYEVYLARLRAYPTQKYLPPADGDQYPNGVAESILLSIDTVTAAGGPGLCTDLLGVISLLAPDGVPRDLLYSGESADVFAAGAEAIDEALGRLADASLLTFGGKDKVNPTVSAHRLVTRVVRERRGHDGTLISLGTRTAALLAAAATRLGQPWQHRTQARDLVQQVIAANGYLAPYVGADDRQLAVALLGRRGWALWCLNELGDSEAQAIELGEPLVADHTRVLGEDHPDTLSSRNNLAYAYRAEGRLDEAVALYERVLADQVRVLGEDHQGTLSSRDNLASAYQTAGRLDEAIALYERVLADRARVLGEDHPDTLTSGNNLAYAYRAAGRLDEAIPLHERVLADRVRLLGEGHPDTLTSRNNLGLAYRAAGRLDEAIALHERVLAGRVRLLGHGHPDTLTSYSNLGLACRAAGRLDEAVALLERVQAGRARVLGVAHPDTLTARNNLASAYRAAGRLDKAIPLFEEALAGLERSLGAAHPDTVIVRANLAVARRAAEGQGNGPVGLVRPGAGGGGQSAENLIRDRSRPRPPALS